MRVLVDDIRGAQTSMQRGVRRKYGIFVRSMLDLPLASGIGIV